MYKKEITIYDIAAALNVSAATVSRALKDHPAISRKTRDKIREKALEMGYQTNALASSLRTSKSYTLGVIVPRLNSNFMSTVLAGMEKAASDAGYHLIIMQSFESEMKEKENAQLLFSHRVDGLMVSTTSTLPEPAHFKPFFAKNIPVVFFDRIPQRYNQYNCVTIDNREAAWQATRHLLDTGKTRVLHITGNTGIQVYKQRLEGYKAALSEANKPFDHQMVWETGLSVEDGEISAKRIMTMKPLPDAIFVANDTCAITIMHHLQKNGIKIPEQIEITGFNNDPFSEFSKPSLTTINYPGEEMGIKTVNLIIDKLNTKHIEPKGKQIVLKFGLLIRESTNQAAK
jgi:LacI family transcriptional regulator